MQIPWLPTPRNSNSVSLRGAQEAAISPSSQVILIRVNPQSTPFGRKDAQKDIRRGRSRLVISSSKEYQAISCLGSARPLCSGNVLGMEHKPFCKCHWPSKPSEVKRGVYICASSIPALSRTDGSAKGKKPSSSQNGGILDAKARSMAPALCIRTTSGYPAAHLGLQAIAMSGPQLQDRDLLQVQTGPRA